MITFLIISLTISLVCCSADEINPDQLQFYLNMSGEGNDRRIHNTYLRSIEMSWQIHTPYHRHLFLASGMDCFSELNQFENIKKTNSRGRVIKSRKTASEKRLLAARSLHTAELAAYTISNTEIEYMFKRFPYYEYEWTQKHNPYKAYSINSDRKFLTLIISGMFYHGLLPSRYLLKHPRNRGKIKSWNNQKISDAELDTFKKQELPKLKKRIYLIFHELLPFLEKWGVLVKKPDDNGLLEAVAFDKTVTSSSRKSMIVLAQALPDIVYRSLGKQMPSWLYKASQSFYITQLGRFALGSQGITATLAASTIQLFRNGIEKSHKISLDSAYMTLETKIKTSFVEWRKNGMPQISTASKIIGIKLALKAVAVGSLTWLAIDFAIKAGQALVSGQAEEDVEIAGDKYNYKSRNQRMQQSGDWALDARRSRYYAFEDAMADWSQNLLVNTASITASVTTFSIGSPLVLGAAAAAGLPTAGVGGALVAASGYLVVGTAAVYAAHHAGKAVTPLQKDFNDVISNGELETKLRVISSQLANPLDQAIFSDRVNDLKDHYRNGNPIRFMAYSNDPSKIKLIRDQNKLWIFAQKHSNGNFFKEVNTNALTALNPDSATVLEAHIRYDILDRKGNQWAWDQYSNNLINLGLMRLNHHSIEFVGKDNFKVHFENSIIKANRSDSDIRVLSNGILMVKDATTNKWAIRGDVANTDIYLRSNQPGRYTWDKTKNGFVKVLSGKVLKKSSSENNVEAKNKADHSRGVSLGSQLASSSTNGEFFEGIEN